MLTTDYRPGAPVWVDLSTPDMDSAVTFYSGLFGWTFHSAGPEAGGYGLFSIDGQTVAAAGPMTEPGERPAWSVYFHTPDADACAETVARTGGTVRSEPLDVFTQGRMANFTDPTGARFSVWQPRETKGLDKVTAANTLRWTELYTSDPAVVREFYQSVFGWTYEDVSMDGLTYTVVRPEGGGPESAQGGIMHISDEMRVGGLTPHWQPYFEVVDAAAAVAAVAERGGSVLMGPEDVEQVGRLAQVADPLGGHFAVITSVPS